MNEPKRTVVLNIVDGTDKDYAGLRMVLQEITAKRNCAYNFIVAPKQLKSLSVEELKILIKEVEDDNEPPNRKD